MVETEASESIDDRPRAQQVFDGEPHRGVAGSVVRRRRQLPRRDDGDARARPPLHLRSEHRFGDGLRVAQTADEDDRALFMRVVGDGGAVHRRVRRPPRRRHDVGEPNRLCRGDPVGHTRREAQHVDDDHDIGCREAIETAIRTPEGTTIWYLRVIHHIAQKADVWTFDIQGEEWGEVDFPEDVKRADALVRGWDEARGTFVQHPGTTEVDAALLLIPAVGFLPGDDSRVLGTIRAVEEDLLRDGLVLRYRTQSGVDGIAGGEHPFLACAFWLVGAYALAGRVDEARALFDDLAGLVNDVGLLSEEYDGAHGRMVGNFPQAFSHLALVGAALLLPREAPPV